MHAGRNSEIREKDPIQFRKNSYDKFHHGLWLRLEKSRENFPIGVLHQNLAEQGVALLEHGSLGFGVCEISLNQEFWQNQCS